MKTMDAKQILDDLSIPKDRGKVSLYLSRGLYAEFKSHCGDVPASRVMERLMVRFTEAYRPAKPYAPPGTAPR